MITSAIVGVGSVDRVKAVHWGVVGDILVAWILTLPAAGAARRRLLHRPLVRVRLSGRDQVGRRNT